MLKLTYRIIKNKISKALASGSDLSLRLSHDDLVGEDLIALTPVSYTHLTLPTIYSV